MGQSVTKHPALQADLMGRQQPIPHGTFLKVVTVFGEMKAASQAAFLSSGAIQCLLVRKKCKF